jgi:hypothetical protein
MIGYLDAGTGSMVAGAIAAGAAGVGVVAKATWQKVSPRRKKKSTDVEETSSVEESADQAEA